MMWMCGMWMTCDDVWCVMPDFRYFRRHSANFHLQNWIYLIWMNTSLLRKLDWHSWPINVSCCCCCRYLVSLIAKFLCLWCGLNAEVELIIDVCVAGGEDDLEYYVRECGDILGISSKLSVNKRSAKDVLQYVFQHVVECKKLNQASLSDTMFWADFSMSLKLLMITLICLLICKLAVCKKWFLL